MYEKTIPFSIYSELITNNLLLIRALSQADSALLLFYEIVDSNQTVIRRGSFTYGDLQLNVYSMAGGRYTLRIYQEGYQDVVFSFNKAVVEKNVEMVNRYKEMS